MTTTYTQKQLLIARKYSREIMINHFPVQEGKYRKYINRDNVEIDIREELLHILHKCEKNEVIEWINCYLPIVDILCLGLENVDVDIEEVCDTVQLMMAEYQGVEREGRDGGGREESS